jgi:hypothetical protein
MHLKRVLATHAFELEQFYLTLFEREPFLRRLSPQAKILSASSEGPRHVCGRDSSFTGLKWSGRMDLNHRPPGPEPGALARLRYAPTVTRPSVYARFRASATAVPRAGLEFASSAGSRNCFLRELASGRSARPKRPLKVALSFCAPANPATKQAVPGAPRRRRR